jgi:hypothetical protein
MHPPHSSIAGLQNIPLMRQPPFSSRYIVKPALAGALAKLSASSDRMAASGAERKSFVFMIVHLAGSAKSQTKRIAELAKHVQIKMMSAIAL